MDKNMQEIRKAVYRLYREAAKLNLYARMRNVESERLLGEVSKIQKLNEEVAIAVTKPNVLKAVMKRIIDERKSEE